MADTVGSPNIFQRLLKVQNELVAPRAINGRFGKARSAEQILEAAKPVCYRHGLYLYTTEEVVLVGDRNYIVQTAHVVNVEKPEETHSASASAWENSVSGGLDTSQVSGKTSSYAKKYALQNLFAIDDTKDADTDEQKSQTQKTMAQQKELVNTVKAVMVDDAPTLKSLTQLRRLSNNMGLDANLVEARIKTLKTEGAVVEAIKKLEEEM